MSPPLVWQPDDMPSVGALDVPGTSWARALSPERREDALLAAVLGLAGLVELGFGAAPGHTLLASLSLLVMSAALVVRRLRPRTCLALVLTPLAIQSILGVPANAQVMTIPVVLVAAYSVGAHLERKASVLGLAMGSVLLSVGVAAGDPGASDYVFGLVVLAGAWVAGVLVQARSAAEAAAIDSAEQQAAQAADAERERIARELHDIVAHGLSAMVVQATAAAELVDRSPHEARKAMHEIQTTGTEAMMEMRHMLGLMRGSEACGRRPQPGLEDVHDLVAAEQAAGRPVSLTVDGAPSELPRGLALSVFRIVQESLTNVRKHARGSCCEVSITCTTESLEVQVVDEGATSSGTTDPGFGIIGMRERAQLYGGTLEARPLSPGGGWVVRARFPLELGAVGS